MGDSKRDRYLRIRRQLAEELGKSDDPVARMATIAALLHHKQPRFSWTGFYRRVENDDLVVGPYQGALACQVLPAGQGVCGAVVERGQPVIVPDVREHPGHIACDARSRSEIVVPFRDERGAVAGVHAARCLRRAGRRAPRGHRRLGARARGPRRAHHAKSRRQNRSPSGGRPES